MEFTHSKSYIKQITVYLKNGESKKAHELTKSYVEQFPTEMVSHFLLAKASFDVGKFSDADHEGRKAFNMSRTYEDMLACALLISIACLETKEYAKGFKLLKVMEKKGTSEELQLALLTFSIALKNENEALIHIEKLYKLNELLAMELIERMIGL